MVCEQSECQFVSPKNCLNSLMSLGTGNDVMALDFSGSASIPCLDATWPRYPLAHLLGFSVNPALSRC